MGLRSIVRRAMKPAAMALVAGSLALTLTVTSTQKAEASPLLIPPVVAGAVSGALPLAAWVGAVTPAGWVILGGVAIAGGLYYTKDYWLPYVTGAFGGPDNNVDAGTTQYDVAPGYRIVDGSVGPGSGANSHKVYWTPSFASGWTSKIVKTLFDNISCRNNTTQVVTTPVGAAETQTYALGDNGYSRSIVACPVGTTVTGVKVGPSALPNSVPPGPENFVTYGSASPAGFDPRGANVQYKNTVECVKPDGTLFNAEAISIGSDGALKYPSCDALWPGAHATGKGTVTGLAPGGTVPEVLYTTPAITGTPYPKCEPGNPGAGCVLSVSIDGKPCTVGDWQCARWAELKTEAPARLQCNYGPYVGVAIDTCNPLERAYETGGAVLNQTNTDGNPATRNDTDPAGNPISKTDIAPSTGTGTGTVPGVGGSPSGVPGASVEEAACWPTGWGMLNPLEWVYKPVVCASKALFEPKKDIQTRVNGMSAAFSNKIPVSWFGVGVEGVSGGACPTNWAVELNGHSYSLICGSAADGIIRGFRPVLGAMLVMAMLWPLIRSLFYSAIPVFKVTPS